MHDQGPSPPSPLPPQSTVKCLVVEKEAELKLDPEHFEGRQRSEKSFNPQQVVACLTVIAGLVTHQIEKYSQF